MRTIKLGLIGAGGISGAHCRTLAEIEGAEIIAAADLVPANLERAKEQWGIKRTFTDYNEMLKMDEIEAVYVCTPTGVHAAPTVASLNAGKHVFCEKPMEGDIRRCRFNVARCKRKRQNPNGWLETPVFTTGY